MHFSPPHAYHLFHLIIIHDFITPHQRGASYAYFHLVTLSNSDHSGPEVQFLPFGCVCHNQFGHSDVTLSPYMMLAVI
jgi:hypothetical protein